MASTRVEGMRGHVGRLVGVDGVGVARLELVVDAVEARRDGARQHEIRVHVRPRDPRLHPPSRPVPHQAEAARAVVLAVDRRRGGPAAGHVAPVRVHGGRGQPGQLLGRVQLAGQEVAAELRQAARVRRAVVVARTPGAMSASLAVRGSTGWCARGRTSPTSSIVHLAMNVVARPSCAAISLMPFLNTRCRSAVTSASSHRTFTSCCPRPASPLEFSTGMPAAHISLRMRRRTYSSRVVCSSW